MAGIRSVQCVVPDNSLAQRDFREVIAGWSELDDSARSRVSGFAERVGVERRNFVIPATQVLELGGLEQRAKIFEDIGSELLLRSAEALFRSTGTSGSSISHIIYTSCSVPIIPTLDSRLVDALDISPTVTRIPVFQYGCAGGVFSLGLAAQLTRIGASVLVMSAELCSLVFQSSDTSTAQLVGTSLFADGAATVLVTPDTNSSAFRIVDWRSSLIPNSRHVMGYDLRDTGLHLRLDQTLPDTLAASFNELSRSFLDTHGLRTGDIAHWLFHPGSIKIVDMLADSIGLRSEQTQWAKDVLRDYGNMSSATILFVLERYLRSADFRKGDRAVIAGVGPGLTVELLLLEAQLDARDLTV